MRGLRDEFMYTVLWFRGLKDGSEDAEGEVPLMKSWATFLGWR